MPPKARKLTKAEIKEVETLAAVLNQAQVADYFNISQDTFQRILARQPDVMRSYKNGKAKAIASVSGNLIKQARDGNTTAAIFYLKTQAGWKEQQDLNVTIEEKRTLNDFYSDS